MTPEQRNAAEKLAALISETASAAERKLAKVVKLYGEAVAMADELAGDDRTGNDAKAALELRALQEQYATSLHNCKSAHALASIFQCEQLDVPMTRGGER